MINFQKTFLLLALAFGSVGCGLPAAWHAKADKLPAATPEDPAVEMICVWEPAEGLDPNGMPTRGFAGNINFFTRRQQTPVRVKGDVRVYVFDDQGPIEKRGQPIHQWDFLGDAWSIHLHDSAIGPGYSVFIPYSRKVSHQVQCALRVKFTPENGSPIYSNTTAVMLPGPVNKKEAEPLSNSRKEKRTSLESITIPLKERQREELENLEVGKGEISRTTAPVSELHRREFATPGRLPADDRSFSRVPVPSQDGYLETKAEGSRADSQTVFPPAPVAPEQTAHPAIEPQAVERSFFPSRAVERSPSRRPFQSQVIEPHPLIESGF